MTAHTRTSSGLAARTSSRPPPRGTHHRAERPRVRSAAPVSFFQGLGDAFLYPARGITQLVLGALFLWLAESAARWSVLGFVLVFGVSGYVVSYAAHVVRRTAASHDEPSFPEITDGWRDLVRPYFRHVLVLAMSLVPAFAVLALSHWQPSPGALVAAGLAFSIYYPAAFLGAALREHFVGALPHHAVRVMLAAPLEYATVVGLSIALGALTGGSVALVARWPLAGGLLASIVFLYALTVQMRALGLLFRAKREQLESLLQF